MVGRFNRIAGKVGAGLPADDRRTAEDALDGLLEASRSEESRARQLACKNLCTCHVRADDDRVWTRLLELVEDPDPLVRGDVLHALTDSTPAPRVPAVIEALESRHNDPDEQNPPAGPQDPRPLPPDREGNRRRSLELWVGESEHLSQVFKPQA